VKNRITRRRFLEQAARAAGGAALGSLPLIQARCKGTTEPEPPPPPAQDVTVSIKFYNHTQGELGEKSYSGKSGQSFGVSIGSLGYSGVDSGRVAVRKAATRDIMGALIGFSRTETISLQYPASDESWEAYLMNAGAQQHYQYIDEDVDLGWGALKHPRSLVWHRGDGDRTGPDEPIFEAIRQLGSALNYPWKVYGSYPQGAAGVAVGYTHLIGIDQGPAYWLLNDSFIWVDPERAPTDIDKLKWFIDAIFGYSTAVFSLGGGGSDGRNQTICDQATGNLNAIGRDLLAYVYVKDVMTSPSPMHKP
jgi:hypothetical protein